MPHTQTHIPVPSPLSQHTTLLTTLRLTLATLLSTICSLSTAQTSSLPTEPIADTYPVLSAEVLTHLYNQSWFQGTPYLDLGADTIGLCDYDGGRLCITSAWLHKTGYPKSYSEKFIVRVSLAVYYPTGEVTKLKHSPTRDPFIYCESCGGIRRNRPTITLNGSTEEEITITYGESITVKSNNTFTVKYNNGVSTPQQGASYFLLDGVKGSNGDIPGVGIHTVLAVSEVNGNNVFKSTSQSGTESMVKVGYEYAEKTFKLTVLPNTVPLTFTQRLTIASRPANGTTRLGKLTLPQPDKLNAQGVSPGTAIAEIDSSAVSPEPGTYTVRYRLTTTNTDYYTIDSCVWYETTFTITEPVTPTPSSHPDFFNGPLINQGDVLSQDILTHIYDYSWYTNGGNVSLISPIELATLDDGKVLISKVLMGSAGAYPTSYSDALPVRVELLYVNAGGDTLQIDGQYAYCDACGTITRQQPIITLNGSEEETFTIKQGDALNAQTSAQATGGVTMFVDGTEVSNGSTPDVGTHTVLVVSAETGNNTFTPEDQVEVGFMEAEKTFTVTVTTGAAPTPDPDPNPDPEPDPEPDPNPDPDITPDSFTEPIIDYGDVLSPDLLTHVYTYKWYAAGGRVDLTSPIELTTVDGFKVLITNVFIGYTGSGTSHSAITSYDEDLPVYVTLSYINASGDTVQIDGRFKYCDSCGSVTRHVPIITLNGSEGPAVSIEYGEALNAQTSAQITFTYNGVPVTETGGCEIFLDGTMAYNTTIPSVGTHTVVVISKLLEHKTSSKLVAEGYARTEKTFTLTVTGEGPCVSDVVRLKFGNTLIVNNSADEYTAYQWMADGQEVAGATSQYYHSNPLPYGSYVVALTKTDGSVVTSCPFEVGDTDSKVIGLKVVQQEAGREVVVVVSGADNEAVRIMAYTAGGVVVARCAVGSDGMARLVLPRGVNVVRATAGQRSTEVRVVCR